MKKYLPNNNSPDYRLA